MYIYIALPYCLTLVLEGTAVFVKSVFKCILCKTVAFDSVTCGILFQLASVY